MPPRAFQIRKEDAEVHGYTRRCAGCTSWFRGLGRQPHNSECRADARYQNAEKRKHEFEDRMREESSTSSPEARGGFREWWTWGTARGAS